MKLSLMCLDIIKNPVKSIALAKKRKNVNKTLMVLVEDAVLFAIAAALIVAKTNYNIAVLGSGLSAFFVTLIGIMLFGMTIHISATVLGGKGKYFEGLTAVAYGAVPLSVGFFIVALLSLVPLTVGIQIVIMAISAAMGLAIIYRGIKDLYSIDMVTSIVVVSIAIIALFIALYTSAGISLLGRAATMVV